MGIDTPSAPLPEELREHYLATGLWDDTLLGALLIERLRAHPQQRMRVWSKTSPAELTFVALALLGAVLVPVAGYYGRKELVDVVNATEAAVLVTAATHGSRNYLDELRDSRTEMPGLRTVVVCGGPAVPDAIAFTELLDVEPIATTAAVDPDQPCLVAFTSGTSGRSKGVIHTHRTLGAEVRQHLDVIVPRGATPQIVASPIAHAAGMTMGLLGPLHRGEAMNVADSFDIDFILDTCHREGLSPGGGAAVFLSALIDHPGFTDEIAARMGYVVLGGSIVPSELVLNAERRGITVLRSYGSTEHPTISAGLLGDAPIHLRSTDGRVLPAVEVVIRRADGTSAPAGVEGEIYSRGPDRCAGYLDPLENAGTFDSDGWLATGDLGVLDGAGHLAVTGRAKDLIIRNGINVSPAEVENALLSCPGIADVAVVGVPDDRTGERTIAFVEPSGSSPPTMGDLAAHLGRVGLAKPKWPEELRLVTGFPRTVSGKIQKYVLRQRIRDEHA